MLSRSIRRWSIGRMVLSVCDSPRSSTTRWRKPPGRIQTASWRLATLPLQDPAAAVTEAERAITELGCRGIYLGTNVRGKELADPSFLPVFERINSLGVPIFLHPLNVIGSQRLTNYYLHNLLGNPFDTAVAAAN